MADIQTLLNKIKTAVYGIEVRQSIHDAIYQCYQDGKAGTSDLVARTNIDNVKNNISNPNLLINGDFRNPINQRGETIYAPTGNYVCYTIDRWYIIPSLNDGVGHSVTVNDGYVTFANTNNNMSTFFGQYLEKEASGKFTLTVKVRAISSPLSITYRDGSEFHTAMSLKEGINTATIECGALDCIRINLTGRNSVDIEYIKLEQGTIATPLSSRLYAEELALCRRYYRSNAVRLVSYQHTATYAYFAYNYEPMRVAPKFSYVGFAETQNHSGATAKSTAVQVLDSTEIDRLTLRITFSDSATAYYRCASGKIMLDAEIY